MGAKGHQSRIPLPNVFMAVVLVGCLVDASAADVAASARDDDAGVEFFESAVRPVLVEHCYECHSSRTAEPKGEFRLDSRDGMRKGGSSGHPAIVAGNAAASPLISAVRHTDSHLRMPPKKKLRDKDIAALEAWVAMGAPDPRATPSPSAPPRDAAGRGFWSFQPPVEPTVPSRANAGWVRTPVDAFIYDALAERNLKPSPEADRRTLIRRASFDLTGLPPTPEEVEQFITDTSAGAYDRLVERLLAGPRYGERWGRYWLDLARYSDTKGYVYRGEERRFVHAHNYRDWVVRAMNEDMPYDRFLLSQIAADQLTPADGARLPQDLAAMGFLTVGRRFLGVVPDIIDDRIDVVMRSAMGLTVSCARCHDHKFDPIPTKDYYSLYGVFAGSTEKTVSLDATPSASAEYRAYVSGYDERVRKLDDAVRTKTDELVARLRAKAGEYIAAAPGATKLPDDVFTMLLGPDDLNPAVVRQWRQYLDRRGAAFDSLWAPWTALSALPEAEFGTKAPAVVRSLLADAARPLNRHVAAAFRDSSIATLADVANVYGKLLTDANNAWLSSAEPSRPAALPDADQEALRLVLYGQDSPTRVHAGSVKDIEWYFDEPTRVQFGTLQAEVDRWILSAPGAPPHGVVLVDRAEQTNPRVFKRGNPSTRGEEVTRHFLSLIAGDDPPAFQRGSGRLEMARAIASADNPLTARVMVNRIWAHHFGTGLVPTPSDFGTRSEPPSHPALLDWLAVQFVKQGWSVKAMHRLMMRSTAYRQTSADRADGLAADPENRLLWRMNRTRLDFESLRDTLLATSGELDLKTGGPASDVSGNRRTIYASIDRQFVLDVFRVFDFANPDLHIPQRATTTVPQQALFFMNAPFASGRARSLAGRPEVQGAASDADRVRQLYRLVYQRTPSDEQIARGIDFVAAIGTNEPDSVTAPARPSIAAWRYGYGSHDATADRVFDFTPLPHFHVNAWQGSAAWPDATLGWVQLTATGGHAGNDLAHAAIRRWVAPRDVTVRVEGDLRHGYVQGNGVTARIVSSRTGTVGRWTVHNSSATAGSPPLELKRGDTIDFVVDHAGDLGYDMFTWAPVITALGDAPAGGVARWSAADDFVGEAAALRLPPLGPWEMYAHVLLSSNEFMFVD